ncbi:MAG: PEPxxWA-CTERM sorting domain-containing protein [Sphingomonadaceae bacterium]
MQFTSYLAATAVLLTAAPALADITIFDTPGAVQPDENVLFQGPPPVGNLAFGVTNQTDTQVTFRGTEPLVTPAVGQARLEAADGAFSSLDFFLSDPLLVFTEVEFNINTGTATSVDLTFTDHLGGLFQGTFGLVAGQNFFSAQATNGQFIKQVSFAANANLDDLRQVRIGGIAAIPEPATWAMMIIGFGLVGFASRRRGIAHATA